MAMATSMPSSACSWTESEGWSPKCGGRRMKPERYILMADRRKLNIDDKILINDDRND